jgi:acid-sensing ion channel, other
MTLLASSRGCFLDNEKPLKFFKKYMKNNCRSECLSNRTVADCGCAQFFMVRDVSTRVCGVLDMKCYKKVEEESQNEDWCECLTECGEIEYKTEQQLKIFNK